MNVQTIAYSLSIIKTIIKFMEPMPKIPNNEEIIEKYCRYMKLKGLRDISVKNKSWGLVPFFKFVNYEKADKVTKEDVEDYLIERRNIKRQNTVYKNISELKLFFAWLKPDNDFFENICVRREKNHLPVENLVTQEDIIKMIPFCISQRDRALLFLMWDSGARIEELLNLNVGSVQFDRYGAQVTLKGKTGMRRIRVIDSVPDLQLWINQHPAKDCFDAPLFPSSRNGRLQRRSAQTILTKLSSKAGIEKPVHPHALRHGRLTDLVKKGLGEMELRIFAGWENNSNMPATYLHLSGGDVEAKLLAIHGIKQEEKEEVMDKTKTKDCPRCGKKNPFDAKYCSSCSLILDTLTALRFEEDKDLIDEKTSERILVDPAIEQLIYRAMKRLKND
jgi:site-specific recombinase XerD/ribosomal protein L40E